MERREFLQTVLRASLGVAAACALVDEAIASGVLREARYYVKSNPPAVTCQLCPRRCYIEPGRTGHCRVRVNRGGKLYTLAYGNPCAVHVDPIEKTPVFHVLPGASALALACAGCTLQCKYCQNWRISQASPTETKNYDLPPQAVIARAKKDGCRAVVFSYTEPTMFFEYMVDIAKLARKNGLKAVVKSCGYINPEPLAELSQYIDAVNVDIKGYSEKYYREICGASMKPPLEAIKGYKQQGVWVEVTNLMIGGLNDSTEMVRGMVRWIKSNLGSATPLILSRFFPAYKLGSLPPLPMSKLERARDLAIKMGLQYVYIGNVPGHEGESVICPQCSRVVVRRIGHFLIDYDLTHGKCKYCGYKLPGIWQA